MLLLLPLFFFLSSNSKSQIKSQPLPNPPLLRKGGGKSKRMRR